MKIQLKRQKIWITIIGISVIVFIVTFASSYLIRAKTTVSANNNNSNIQTNNLPDFTVSDLSVYNGDDPNKPIYIGLNGYVYDVTAGRNYYENGGTYHFLAGKDSSKELNIIGGDIIKKKYPVVGKLVN